jgi:histidine phosphotransferase ChpT
MADLIPGLRLAELLAARLCHELVSPVGAIANGVEILAEEPGFAREAGALIEQSAREARRRLQFYRLAYGATADVTADAARKASLDLFADGKIACDWPVDAVLRDGSAKLVCNLLVVAAETLPRGGRVVLAIGAGESLLSVTASGVEARLTAAVAELLTRPIDVEALVPRTAHTAFTAALASRMGRSVVPVALSADAVKFTVR